MAVTVPDAPHVHHPRGALAHMFCGVQVVTDEMWEDRANRFPEHMPNTREYYLLRSIFEEQFPSKQAMATVPKVQRILRCCSAWCGPAFSATGPSKTILPPTILCIIHGQSEKPLNRMSRELSPAACSLCLYLPESSIPTCRIP